MTTRLSLLLLISVVFTRPASADNLFINDAEAPTPASVTAPTAWREAPLQLPSWPRDNDLIAIPDRAANARFDYFIDSHSLHTSADNVVRYTVIATARDGARNISYEGLRCTPRGQYKLYAYGTQQHFEPIDPANLINPTTSADTWQSLDDDSDSYRRILWQWYFCDNKQFIPRTRTEQLRLLRNGRSAPSMDDHGFLTE
ncbi:CNP1-like family protein [Thiospirillum jenense]|uniref:CNP1-like family protein n=1 Tax=Thiospirillum jenense TaxID=1653858 RepID=UPI001EEBC078|nr:CNP1-like family protein [Thiospirillum jenense]